MYIPPELLGKIICKVNRKDLFDDSVTYELTGGPYFRIGINFIATDKSAKYEKGVLTLGPYQFIEIDEPMWGMDKIFILTSRANKFRVVTHRFKKWCEKIYRRLIYTAHIWELAEIPPGAVPSYRDLYFVKWLNKVFKKK